MQSAPSNIITFELSERSHRRLSTLVAQTEGARHMAETVLAAAQQAIQVAQNRADEALQGFAEAAGIDLPPLFELRLEPRSNMVYITPKMIGPDGRATNIPPLEPLNGHDVDQDLFTESANPNSQS